MTKLTGGYFGTRGPEMFSQYFHGQIAETSRFIDITGGTGQFPYYLATERKMRVGLVERCPYVGYLLKAIFSGEELQPVNWLTGEDDGPGVLTQMLKSGDVRIGRAINERVARSIDGFMLANKCNPLALHCMGRAITRCFLYRGMSISRTTQDGSPTIAVLPPQVFRIAKRTYERMAALQIQNKRHWVAVGDSTKVIGKIPADVIRGATVYADPAWPYAKQFGSTNPYRLAYEFLSSIMVQRQLRLDKMWEIDSREQIYGDVATWIDTAFVRGAKQFILCSQDTNYPNEDTLLRWVMKHWRVKKHERSDDFSSFANRKYITYWFYLLPK